MTRWRLRMILWHLWVRSRQAQDDTVAVQDDHWHLWVIPRGIRVTLRHHRIKNARLIEPGVSL